ncbi:branched-chain amino acid ABC transporter permease [Yinghuangia seranimata]|uniref:branched-chain amino acid ABC transporter permease n=1 Tax=Yinghuangia seranimata TaxID=408067 RepID=UPI00248AB252|nr:branched-chain amino acid ABC transporter permease [Yinghuangia seranimata]MDI2128107.1 branched-chain amino acid ABC transporter permease [Yinghuangia seranimata]
MSDRLAALLRPAALGTLAGLVVLAALPFYLTDFWLLTGLFAMAAALGAIGLNLLSGTTGQLSLGHSFFLAVGAYGYIWFAGDDGRSGTHDVTGLGLPTPIALVAAVLLAGVMGGLFSPISGRLRGMYLGVATLALVFIGEHVMNNATTVTGGYNGRAAEPMTFFGFTLTDREPHLEVLGIEFGAYERLWYLALVLLVVGVVVARNLLRGRPGRALGAVRDSEIAAAVMGVPVARYRSAAFVVSSMYAGLAGVLLALVFGRVIPDYFGLALSIDYLAMIVIGGLGSVGGAVAGAAFVTVLPQLFAHYAGALPLVTATGTDGIGPQEASRYLYGAAIVLVLLFSPGGLAGLARRTAAPRRRAAGHGATSRPRTKEPQGADT